MHAFSVAGTTPVSRQMHSKSSNLLRTKPWAQWMIPTSPDNIEPSTTLEMEEPAVGTKDSLATCGKAHILILSACVELQRHSSEYSMSTVHARHSFFSSENPEIVLPGPVLIVAVASPSCSVVMPEVEVSLDGREKSAPAATVGSRRLSPHCIQCKGARRWIFVSTWSSSALPHQSRKDLAASSKFGQRMMSACGHSSAPV